MPKPRKRKFATIREAMQANAAARWAARTKEERRAELAPACAASPVNKPRIDEGAQTARE